LIAANLASQKYHLPWVTSFTDQNGFDAWFALPTGYRAANA
jgi:ribosomal-protein-alanine N-acetyltransferase